MLTTKNSRFNRLPKKKKASPNTVKVNTSQKKIPTFSKRGKIYKRDGVETDSNTIKKMKLLGHKGLERMSSTKGVDRKKGVVIVVKS